MTGASGGLAAGIAPALACDGFESVTITYRSSAPDATVKAIEATGAGAAAARLDFLDEVAVFSIFRRTSEMPLFRVEKRPKLRGKQGMYSVIAATGHILKRGHDLPQVLRAFDRTLMKAMVSGS